MKTLIITILTAGSLVVTSAGAQIINWQSLQDSQRHVASVNVGWDYSTSFGIGYSYRMETKIPMLFNAQFSLPAGDEIADDFKAKLGLQVRVFKSGNFQGSVAAYGIFRKAHTPLATFKNFGSEFAAIAGYYKSRWFVAAEFGFDKAITTLVQHSERMHQLYPGVRDGWYIPTGGNFCFALQAGYTIRNVDLYLKAGRVLDQYLKTTATVPLTAQLGINVRF